MAVEDLKIEPKHKNIHEAMLAAQKEFPVVKKSEENPFFKSKYAGLPSILEVVLPILHKHGMFVIQCPVSNESRVGIKTTICHSSKEGYFESEFTMNLSKNDPQGAGSAITYARRYALVSMLGLNVDEDDDGNIASTSSKTKKTPKPGEVVVFGGDTDDDEPFPGQLAGTKRER